MRLPEFDTAGIPYRFLGTSALDTFCELPAAPVLYAATETDTVGVASLYDTPDFPGLAGWDLAVESAGHEILVRTDDNGSATAAQDPLSSFSWNPRRRAFSDPHGIYPLLFEIRRRIRTTTRRRGASLDDVEPVSLDAFPDVAAAVGTIDLTTAARVTARLPIIIPTASIHEFHPDEAASDRFHRTVLIDIVTGPWARRGLETLRRGGYLDFVLPELARMDDTEHSKEGHPEGNVWQHSIETLRYRKRTDLLVGLALLFHDSGKPQAKPNGRKKFDGHADIGARITRRALERLGFDGETIDNVVWLVRYHMIPGALKRLPEYRRDPIMASELFPLLLEVYRCDLSSTFRGPDNYYDACAIYRRYLKTNRNRRPARTVMETYVE